MSTRTRHRRVSILLCAAGTVLGGCGGMHALVPPGQDAGVTPGAKDASAAPGATDVGTTSGPDGSTIVGPAIDAAMGTDQRGQAATATANNSASCVSIHFPHPGRASRRVER